MAGDSVFNNGNHGLSAKFVSVGTGVPLQDRDVIAIGPNYNKSPYNVDNIDAIRAVNFRSIIEGRTAVTHGQAEIYGLSYGQAIDFSADDAYTQALDKVTEAVQMRIDADPEMQALLHKEDWNRDDCVAWERRTSRYVSEEVDNIPGLDSYRHAPATGDNSSPFTNNLAETRALEVNDLSKDIEKGTTGVEFDCETMSLTEGVVLQRIEDRNLPPSAVVEGSYKESSSYFYTSGLGFTYGPVLNSTGHAFIVSSATGSVIEATAEPIDTVNQYQEAPAEFSFKNFAGGAAILGPDAAYVSYAEGGLTGNLSDYQNIDIQTIIKISAGDNGRTFQDYLDDTKEKSAALRDHMKALDGLPETHALSEMAGIQENRPLSLMETDTLKDLYGRSEASGQFAELDNRVADMKERLLKLTDMAGNDPEKLRQLEQFFRDEQGYYNALDTKSPYALQPDDPDTPLGYTAEQTIREEIDGALTETSLKARVYQKLDQPEEAPTRGTDHENNGALFKIDM